MTTNDALLAEADAFLRASANGLRKAGVPESEIEDYLRESITARLAAALRASEQRLAEVEEEWERINVDLDDKLEAAEAKVERLEGALRKMAHHDQHPQWGWPDYENCARQALAALYPQGDEG